MKTMKAKKSVKWLREKAAIEDQSLLSVGGLVTDLEKAAKRSAEWIADPEKADRKDVLVYEIKTRRVESIPAPDRGTTGFHTIEKALDLLGERCNDAYNVAAVPVGKYKKGDIIDEKDL